MRLAFVGFTTDHIPGLFLSFAATLLLGVAGPVAYIVWVRAGSLADLGLRRGDLRTTGTLALLFAGVQFALTLWAYDLPAPRLSTGDIDLPWASIAGFADVVAVMAVAIWLAHRHETRRPRQPQTTTPTPFDDDLGVEAGGGVIPRAAPLSAPTPAPMLTGGHDQYPPPS